MHPLFSLAGRRALVTGGTSGIGLAVTRLFLEAGASVVATSDDAEACAAVTAELSGLGAVSTLCLRLGTREASETLAEQAAEALGGPVDCLVACAGIEGPVGPSGAAAASAYEAVFDVNLHANHWLASALAPGMARAGGGAMVFVSSIAGLRGNRAIGLYGMTKAALGQLARNVAVGWGPRGIRANAIAPGLIETRFAGGLLADAAFMHRRLDATPLRRTGTPDEVAGTALWLASAGGAFTTGQVIVVDGGTLVSD